MSNNKLLSDDDKKRILSERAKEIKIEMQKINENAVRDFYSIGVSSNMASGVDFLSQVKSYQSYERTNGFFELGKNPNEIYSNGTLTLTYKYSATDLSVNGWTSPWGIFYPGSPEWAFDTGFVHGLHGGPRPNGKGGWSWNGVTKSNPIWNLIVEGVYSM